VRIEGGQFASSQARVSARKASKSCDIARFLCRAA
jgi:hypothetical protein